MGQTVVDFWGHRERAANTHSAHDLAGEADIDLVVERICALP